MDPHKLAATHTVEELAKMATDVHLDQSNLNPPGSVAILNKKGQKKADAIAWAITYRRCADKGTPFQAATFNNYKTRYFNR